MKIISDVNPRWFLLVFFESLKASGLVPTLTPSDELLLAVPRLRLKNWWIFPKHHFSSCMFTWNCWSKFPSLRKGIRFFFRLIEILVIYTLANETNFMLPKFHLEMWCAMSSCWGFAQSLVSYPKKAPQLSNDFRSCPPAWFWRVNYRSWS